MNNIAEQIRDCKSKINDLEFQLAVERAVLGRLTAINNLERLADSSDARPIIPDSIVPHIASVMQRASKPMKVKELLSAIQRQNIPIEGKTEPKRLISSALTRRDDLFERVGRGLYQLKEKEPMPIGDT